MEAENHWCTNSWASFANKVLMIMVLFIGGEGKISTEQEIDIKIVTYL